jgi:hypothetical protein
MDELYPTTLLVLEERFGTEQACHDYLFQLRWPKGFLCPRCNHDGCWLCSKRFVLNVRIASFTPLCWPEQFFKHKEATSPLGSFHMAHHEPEIWSQCAWAQRVLGLGSYRTAWSWMHKLRRAMVRPGRDSISGIIHVDETFMVDQKLGSAGVNPWGRLWYLFWPKLMASELENSSSYHY